MWTWARPSGRRRGALLRARQLLREERREGRVRTLDLKRFVDRVDLVSSGPGVAVVVFRVAATPSGSARPERVVEALGDLAGVGLDMRRGVRTRLVLA